MMEQAILIEMPIDMFWYDDPSYYWRYVNVYQQKQKAKAQEINDTSWLQGVYMLRAIVAALDGKKHKYPNKPLEYDDKRELTEQEKAVEATKLYKNLQNWTAGLKGKFSKDTNK